MEKKRIPSLLLSILFAEVGETMGRRSLIRLLRQAGLPGYIDHLPPRDDTPSITVEHYSRLLADLLELFGADAARSIFWAAGRQGAAELWRQQPTQFALAGSALRLLPAARRIELLLDRLAEQGEDLYGTRHDLHELDNAYTLELPGCPYCAEIARRNPTRHKPVCHIPVAGLAERLEWAMGQVHLVEEVACIALGDPVCRFRISK